MRMNHNSLVDSTRLTGVGILLDADTDKSPPDRYAPIRDALRTKGFAFPDNAGIVSPATPHFGAFVMPDNQSQGALEDILLECAEQVYARLLASATAHVDAAFRDASLVPDDLEELRKPSGRKKATVGSIASILRPGRAA
jgi:hypothetical protein